MYPRRVLEANGANFTVVVRSNEGLKGALRGKGFGPWIEAVILREEDGAIRVVGVEVEVLGISRYAEPEAEGIIEVCRTEELLILALLRLQYSLSALK
jgi:hypothetical protein